MGYPEFTEFMCTRNSCGAYDAYVTDINDFFIYETSGGSYFVVAAVLFSLKGTCDYEQEIKEADLDVDWEWINGELQPIPYRVGTHTRTVYDSEDFEADIRVTLSLILENESINKVHIESSEILHVRS
jgi:hypothetical protein